MPWYAKIRNSDFAIVGQMNVDDPSNISNKFGPAPKEFRVVPVVRGTDPALPDNDHRYGDWEYNVDPIGDPTQVLRTLEVIALTPDEEAERDRVATIKSFYPALDAGTATSAQVQKLLREVLIDYYGE